MLNRSKIAVAAAGAIAVGVMAWQGWHTYQLQQQLTQLQQQVTGTAAAGPQPLAATPLPPTTAPALPPLSNSSPFNSPPFNSPPSNSPPGSIDPFWGGQDPFADMQKMQQQLHQRMQQLMSGSGFDKDFDSFFDLDPFQGGFGFGSTMGFGGEPHFEFKDANKNYEVAIDIPQGSNVEINTQMQGRELTIEGKVTSEQQTQGKATSRQTQQFARTFTLPADADSVGITTSNHNGKVVITIPKTDKPTSTLSQQLPKRRGVSI